MRRDTAFYSSPAYTAAFDRTCSAHHTDKFLGCEDMHLITVGARTFLFATCLSTLSDRARVFSDLRASDTLQRTLTHAPPPADRLLRWDLASDTVTTLTLAAPSRTFNASSDAAFHGFDINLLPDGTLTLYLINHRLAASTIEKFTHDPATTTIAHTATIPAPPGTNPNSIHALPLRDGDNAFYMTSDRQHVSGALRFLEDWTRRPWSRVLYHSAGAWRTALSRVAGANGITGAGNRVFVSATLGGAVVVAEETDGHPGVLRVLQTVPLGFMPDNVVLAGAGGADLYVAGHVAPAAVAQHVRGADAGPAGSVVARIGTAQLGSAFFGAAFTAVPSVEEVFVDVAGRWVNASTTAVFRGAEESESESEEEEGEARRGELYVTGLSGRGILKCVDFK